MTDKPKRIAADNEIRIKIAEACEWEFDHRHKGSRKYEEIIVIKKGNAELGVFFPGDSNTQRGSEMMNKAGVPDYPQDLNAIHEAEKKGLRTDEQIETYLEALTDICGGDTPKGTASFTAYFATARQRAEAFLRAIEVRSK